MPHSPQSQRHDAAASPPAPPAAQSVIPPRAGLLHVLDAGRYSIAGLRRLWQETAARLEAVAALVLAALFVWHGASLAEWLGLALAVLAVLVVETLNTALEVLTDRVSPEWSEAARDAKDLGSLAVALSLIGAGLYGAWVLLA